MAKKRSSKKSDDVSLEGIVSILIILGCLMMIGNKAYKQKVAQND